MQAVLSLNKQHSFEPFTCLEFVCCCLFLFCLGFFFSGFLLLFFGGDVVVVVVVVWGGKLVCFSPSLMSQLLQQFGLLLPYLAFHYLSIITAVNCDC